MLPPKYAFGKDREVERRGKTEKALLVQLADAEASWKEMAIMLQTSQKRSTLEIFPVATPGVYRS